MKKFKNQLYILFWLFFVPFLLICYTCAIYVRIFANKQVKSRLVWGSTPIINYSIWSRLMKENGYNSETYTIDFYTRINSRKDWDKLVYEEFNLLPKIFKPFLAFIHSLFKYDIYFISFDGFFIGNTPAKYFQASILHLAGKKIIVIPYGADAYVYQRIRSVNTLHGLLMSYPQAAKKQKLIAKNVDYWCEHADCVIQGFMSPDGFGRWDILFTSPFFLDLEKKWTQSNKNISTLESNEPIIIAHAPNHRGFKGTEFIINAVDILKNEGFNLKLKLLENMQNDDVRLFLQNEADILVEQLVATGHGLNAIEGLASGIVVIANLEDKTYTDIIRRWSFFNECPIVSSTPDRIVEDLRKLVTNRKLIKELSISSRLYAEKYHGLDSGVYFFENIIDFVNGKNDNLLNLYHPLSGFYPNRSPKISHPLVNNNIS